MLNAHINSMILLATPFKASSPQPFEFGHGSSWSDITAKIRAEIPVMLAHRLTPPPRETYSLNRCVTSGLKVMLPAEYCWFCYRKLSGTFLLASRLGASINTKEIWDRIIQNYKFSS